MTRWERFKHVFEGCTGKVLAREYLRPTGRAVKGWGPEGQQLVEETMYGVTLFHCRCEKCGRRWTNRHLGDWRNGAIPAPSDGSASSSAPASDAGAAA